MEQAGAALYFNISSMKTPKPTLNTTKYNLPKPVITSIYAIELYIYLTLTIQLMHFTLNMRVITQLDHHHTYIDDFLFVESNTIQSTEDKHSYKFS